MRAEPLIQIAMNQMPAAMSAIETSRGTFLTIANGPDYLKPFALGGAYVVPMPILPPRVFRLGVRWKF